MSLVLRSVITHALIGSPYGMGGERQMTQLDITVNTEIIEKEKYPAFVDFF